MTDAESQQADWTRPGDEALLEFLASQHAEYPAIVANRTGMHLAHVERRFDAFATRGLVEPVTGEVVYRITEDGEQYLDTGVLPE